MTTGEVEPEPTSLKLERVEAEPRRTFGHITDTVLVVVAATGPGHIVHGEGLVGAQHDDLDGT